MDMVDFSTYDAQGRYLKPSDVEELLKDNANLSNMFYHLGIKDIGKDIDYSNFWPGHRDRLLNFIGEIREWCEDCITEKQEGENTVWEIDYDNPEDSYIELKITQMGKDFMIRGWNFHWASDPSNPAALHFTNDAELWIYVGEDYQQKYDEIRGPGRKIPWQAINRRVIL